MVFVLLAIFEGDVLLEVFFPTDNRMLVGVGVYAKRSSSILKISLRIFFHTGGALLDRSQFRTEGLVSENQIDETVRLDVQRLVEKLDRRHSRNSRYKSLLV